ncbi:hypothetical protein ACVWW1_008863 [Bradyrhizobium sp. JR3.5]
MAEKFEALVTLGVANSRLKDFYDLWVISRTFELRRATLVEAIQRTFERRGTVLPSVVPVGLTDEFAEAWAAQWRAFLALQLQFFLEMGFARSCLMSPAPKRPCEDAGVRDTSLV